MRRPTAPGVHACVVFARVDADFNLLAAAVNVARLAVLGLGYDPSVGCTAAI